VQSVKTKEELRELFLAYDKLGKREAKRRKQEELLEEQAVRKKEAAEVELARAKWRAANQLRLIAWREEEATITNAAAVLEQARALIRSCACSQCGLLMNRSRLDIVGKRSEQSYIYKGTLICSECRFRISDIEDSISIDEWVACYGNMSSSCAPMHYIAPRMIPKAERAIHRWNVMLSVNKHFYHKHYNEYRTWRGSF